MWFKLCFKRKYESGPFTLLWFNFNVPIQFLRDPFTNTQTQAMASLVFVPSGLVLSPEEWLEKTCSILFWHAKALVLNFDP